MLFLDDAESQLGKVLQFDLLLLHKTRRQFARVEDGNSQQAQEAEADQGIDLSANSHSEPVLHCRRHFDLHRMVGIQRTIELEFVFACDVRRTGPNRNRRVLDSR